MLTRLATGSEDNTARVWDAVIGRELIRVIHDEGVRAVAFVAQVGEGGMVGEDVGQAGCGVGVSVVAGTENRGRAARATPGAPA